MKRVLKLTIAVAVVSVTSVATMAAQSVRFGLGGGLISPLSDYKNLDKTGWHALASAEFGIPLSPVGIRVDGLYGQTKHKAPFENDGNTKLMGALASLVWKIPVPAPIVKPYLLAGGGFYNVKLTIPSQTVDSSESKFAYAFGAGLNVGAGPLHLFAEGRYVSIQTSGTSTKFIPVTVGVQFGM